MTKINRITGTDAIDYAEAHGLSVQKYTDPTEGARAVTVEEARAIAREDPSLLWVMPIVTDEQIRALRTEAAAAGDAVQVDLCTAALDGDDAARAACGRAIDAARAMAD